MNSHICFSSPSFIVAVNWRRMRFDSQSEAKINDAHHPMIIRFQSRSHCQWHLPVWLQVGIGIIHHGETTEIVWQTTQPANVLESDSLVKLAIHSDQSPRNCYLTMAWFHGDDVTITYDVPLALRKKENYPLNSIWVLEEWSPSSECQAWSRSQGSFF